MSISRGMTAGQSNAFEERFTNQFESLMPKVEAAVRFLEERGVKPATVNLAHLAIEEIATNILKYGYDDDRTHEIVLRVQVEPGEVRVQLEDDGHEFDPRTVPPPDLNVPVDEREPGGLGIHLVRKLARHIDYERYDGRNRLTVSIAS